MRWITALLIPVALVCSAMGFLYNRELPISERIQQIPLEDAVILEDFFRALVLEDTGGYVLFGDKPMTLAGGYRMNPTTIRYVMRGAQERWALARGWKVWEKYRKKFPLKNYILNIDFYDDDLLEVVLISKKNVLDLYRKHRRDFHSILGSKKTPEDLLDDFSKRPHELFDALNRHEALLGILLGFGRGNSWLFHYREHGLSYRHLLIVNPKPLLGFSSIEEERQFFARKMRPFHAENRREPFLTKLPSFIADLDAPETIELKENYEEQRRNICRAYWNGQFLEVTLMRLCS